MSSSFTVVELKGYKQDGDGPYRQPAFPGTQLGPNSNVRDGEPPYASTTKQNNRRTNVSIPYSRRSNVSKDDVWERKLRHGELVFTHGRMQPGSHCLHPGATTALTNVYGVDYVNEYMEANGPYSLPRVDENAPPFQPHYLVHPLPRVDGQVVQSDLGVWLPDSVKHWQPDGVLNVADQLGGDDVANVTIQGVQSMINSNDHGRKEQRVCARSDLPLSRLYVGLRATKTASVPPTYTFKMELFSSGMVRMGEVVMDGFGSSNSKLVKVWQYGRLIDSRHVESMHEQRCSATIFIQPPVVPRPAQPFDTPRMGSVYRRSHLSPPNGLLWRLLSSSQSDMPKAFKEYEPKDGAGTSKKTQLEALIRANKSINTLNVKLNQVGWDPIGISHSHKQPTLFYNMYMVVDGNVYVPIPDDEPGDRYGAFALPHLQHGRESDPWGDYKLLDGSTAKGPRTRDAAIANTIGPTYPSVPLSSSPTGVIDEVTFGRRPGWGEADVEQQLWRREMPHVHVNKATYIPL